MSQRYLPLVYFKSKESLRRVSPSDRVLANNPGEYRRDIIIETDNENTVNQGFDLHIFDAGEGCFVMASDTDVSFTKSSGLGTLTVPQNTILCSAKISGDSSDLNSNKFTVRFNIDTEDYNQDIDSFFPPLVQVLNTSSQVASGPSTVLPFIYDEGTTPQVQLTRLDGGIVDVTIINLNQFANWTIICVF